MKGWLKNKGTSVKSRRGNGSKKQKYGLKAKTCCDGHYTYRIGAGAKGRKLLGNSNCSSNSWMDDYKPVVSKRRHDNIIARAEIRACTPLRENCW